MRSSTGGEDDKEDRDQQADRGVEKAKKDEAGIDRDLGDAKRVGDIFVAKEKREQIEHDAGLEDGGGQHLRHMPELEVTHLVGKHRQYFRRLQLVDQGVEKDDAL